MARLEMTRKEEIHLYKRNGKINELYQRDVRKSVKKKRRIEDELAIHRKMLNRAFEIILSLHGGEISDEIIEEFNSYNGEVEQIKKDLKEELGI